MTNLAKACMEFRAKHNLTQAEMGKRCGVTRWTILNVENSRPVTKMTETKVRLVIEREE